jgi:rubrerythrin
MNDRYRFVCRECGVDVVVDGEVRADILDSGCPLCDAPAEESDFAPFDSGAGDQSS